MITCPDLSGCTDREQAAIFDFLYAQEEKGANMDNAPLAIGREFHLALRTGIVLYLHWKQHRTTSEATAAWAARNPYLGHGI